jgi:uncharacterized protein (TIGR02646 family)
VSFEKINIPYQHTNEDLNILNADYPVTPSDWNKDKYTQVKARIISHLRNQQENLCCYCKNPLGYDLKQVDIEHIIPKSTHVQFTFEPKNLALSCPSCNTKKSTKNVLARTIRKYPKDHEKFLIVHPHFSNYSDHICLLGGIIYSGKDQRGNNTIGICELTRPGLARNNALKTIEQSMNPLELDVEIIRTCDDATMINEIYARINQLINKHTPP